MQQGTWHEIVLNMTGEESTWVSFTVFSMTANVISLVPAPEHELEVLVVVVSIDACNGRESED